ncbi:type VII secretion target [Nocardia neocaledoniensis]|nr:type VII secretion target [Nocardia neocaledoniensis]
MDIDLDVLREKADQHERVARDTREWAKPPTEWLAKFRDAFGTIAAPVEKALNDYYNARQLAGEKLAKEHDDTAEALRTAVQEFETADNTGGSAIRQAGNGVEGTPLAPTQQGPVAGPAWPGNTTSDPADPAAQAVAPTSSAAPTVTAGAGPGGPEDVAPETIPEGTEAGAQPDAAVEGVAPLGPGSGMPPASASEVGAPLVSAAAPMVGAGPMASTSSETPAGRGNDQTPGSTTGGPVPLTPFAAAIAAAKDRAAAADPAAADASESGDLLLARTLLAGVLAAVDSPAGTVWAASVMRGPAGIGVFLTSNEGRGWLPAGLYLPREVSTPWQWDELLAGTPAAGSPWEGIGDPAWVLAEFGSAWGMKSSSAMSALVSSGVIDADLRARFGDVAMQDRVVASRDVDLRVPTADTVDRLALAGPLPAIEFAAAVPDTQIRSRIVDLVVEAESELAGQAGLTPDIGAVRSLRQAIVGDFRLGVPVPEATWARLRELDARIAGAAGSGPRDIDAPEAGRERASGDVAQLRSVSSERRCNEMVLLLANDPTRQVFRDVVFAHAQVVEHPRFGAVEAQVSAPASQPGRATVPGAQRSNVTAAPDVAPPQLGA